MTARSILAAAAMLIGAIIVTLSMSSNVLAAAKRTCGPDLVQVAPGKRLDPTYKGSFKCTPSNLVDCGNGKSCPRGATCLYKPDGGPAGCKGVVLGPLCRDGKRCPSGYLCMPSPGNGCYDPKISYTCGVAVCGNELRYAPGDRCYPCFARRGGRT